MYNPSRSPLPLPCSPWCPAGGPGNLNSSLPCCSLGWDSLEDRLIYLPSCVPWDGSLVYRAHNRRPCVCPAALVAERRFPPRFANRDRVPSLLGRALVSTAFRAPGMGRACEVGVLLFLFPMLPSPLVSPGDPRGLLSGSRVLIVPEVIVGCGGQWVFLRWSSLRAPASPPSPLALAGAPFSFCLSDF